MLTRTIRCFALATVLLTSSFVIAEDVRLLVQQQTTSTSSANKEQTNQPTTINSHSNSYPPPEHGTCSKNEVTRATDDDDGASAKSNTEDIGTSIKSDDDLENGVLDPLQADPSCDENASDCWQPPDSTIETEDIRIDATCSYGGDDPSDAEQQCPDLPEPKTFTVDKHWGSNEDILRMRDKLRSSGTGVSHDNYETHPFDHERPPIFLMPGLAATRLVAWRNKKCDHHPLLSDIKIQDYVWLNINQLIQMGTIKVDCWTNCMKLGRNQSDTDELETGCKLRADEGLDAISSLAPGGLGSQLLVGGTNTVYAWLIQWLADNLGYDVSNIIGLPYDWRLSPDIMEKRDGFLTLTRHRIEAAVRSNGRPGIMVAHSMGNQVFRYFLAWLRQEMRDEAFARYVKQAERRAARTQAQINKPGHHEVPTTGASTSGWQAMWNSVFGEMEEDEGLNDVEELKQSRHWQLWELAKMEGDENYIEWLETHVWTYVGLSAPLLGAVNPLRAVISGENMGLPITDAAARIMELTFGSTHTVNSISSKMAFCDNWEEKHSEFQEDGPPRQDLACLDDLVREIESIRPDDDPWANYPQLRSLLKDRVDWDSNFPMIAVYEEICDNKREPSCNSTNIRNLGPKDVQTGEIFSHLARVWKEKDDPLVQKREQLEQSWWTTNVPNILNRTWDRPHIKNIIMAYGVDLPTEVAYLYKKREFADKKGSKSHFDDIPNLERVIWEEAGSLKEEKLDAVRGKLTDAIIKKKAKLEPLSDGSGNATLLHSGDGTVPYLSLSWAHTWLLHAIRAKRYSDGLNPLKSRLLEDVDVSHRPEGAMEWIKGAASKDKSPDGENKKGKDDDTGTNHPHGTKYKPEMKRFRNSGRSRKTGLEYTTTVIEAIGVEHKETTRNYDILAACFTEVLQHMHKDFPQLVT